MLIIKTIAYISKSMHTHKCGFFSSVPPCLQVPGVSENRPSVLRGDHLLLTKNDDLNSQPITKYKGYVHRVELDRLKLGFSQT